jgi:8-oxo-dGTP pyrophosphatase MutT (NUDIX family)
MRRSAGVVIILNKNKILLSHSTNSKWELTYSFPKGGIEEGESKKEAAIRECLEETSIVISKEQISNKTDPIIVDYTNKRGNIYKRIYLYTIYISNISEIGLFEEIVPYENLQIEEIDWTGFLTKDEAIPKIFHRVRHLLNLID